MSFWNPATFFNDVSLQNSVEYSNFYQCKSWGMHLISRQFSPIRLLKSLDIHHHTITGDETLNLKFLWNVFFPFFFFFIASKSDILTKFCISICKDVLLTEPCNLHDLYSCTDSNKHFYTLLNISLFWDTKFYHLGEDMLFAYLLHLVHHSRDT